MTGDEFQSMLKSLAGGWTSRDYPKVIGCFSADVFYSDPLRYAFSDSSSLLAFFEDDDGRPQKCEFHYALFDEPRQVGAAEYTYEGTFRYHGTVWIEVKNDKISRWREYQHKSEKSWEEFWDPDERNCP